MAYKGVEVPQGYYGGIPPAVQQPAPPAAYPAYPPAYPPAAPLGYPPAATSTYAPIAPPACPPDQHVRPGGYQAAGGHTQTVQGPMVVAAPQYYAHAQYAPAPAQGGTSMGCVAWTFFGLGFIFPVMWILCMLVPVYVRSAGMAVTDRDRKLIRGATIASGVMIGLMIAAIVVAVAVTVSAANELYSSYSYSSQQQANSSCFYLYGQRYCV